MIKKQNIITALLLSFSTISTVLSQTTVFNGKVNLRMGGSVFNSKDDSRHAENAALLFTSASYNFSKYIDAGFYVGYGGLSHPGGLDFNETTGMYEWYSADSTSYIITNNPYGGKTSTAVKYGLTTDIHLMALLTEKETRLDLYLQAQAGLTTEKYEALEDEARMRWTDPQAEYGIGMGVRYRFTKSVGIFTDYSYGKFYNNDRHKIKLGLAFTF